MAKTVDTISSFKSISRDIEQGKFTPIYILMGEEPYFCERICDLISEKALQPHEKDFNYNVLYGADASADGIYSLCQAYPMMAERTVVIIKEAQGLRDIEKLDSYFDHISPTTILVLFLSGKSLDKRTAFYKKALKYCTVFESEKVSQEAVPDWIENYFAQEGLEIEPKAAMLLAEYAGNDLRKIVIEADKLTKAIPENRHDITVGDIEKNVGMSRELSTTELTEALAHKDSGKAYGIAYYFGESPKRYPLQMTLGFLFYFFSKVEMLHAWAAKGYSNKDAASKAGIFWKYSGPYLAAASNYSLPKVMRIIAWLRECDYKSKSNTGGNATEGELLIELISKILS